MAPTRRAWESGRSAKTTQSVPWRFDYVRTRGRAAEVEQGWRLADEAMPAVLSRDAEAAGGRSARKDPDDAHGALSARSRCALLHRWRPALRSATSRWCRCKRRRRLRWSGWGRAGGWAGSATVSAQIGSSGSSSAQEAHCARSTSGLACDASTVGCIAPFLPAAWRCAGELATRAVGARVIVLMVDALRKRS